MVGFIAPLTFFFTPFVKWSNFIDKKPYVRSNPGDGYVPLPCSDDHQCPMGTRCYVPKNKNSNILNNGVCVFVYDKQLLKTIDPEIW